MNKDNMDLEELMNQVEADIELEIEAEELLDYEIDSDDMGLEDLFNLADAIMDKNIYK